MVHNESHKRVESARRSRAQREAKVSDDPHWLGVQSRSTSESPLFSPSGNPHVCF